MKIEKLNFVVGKITGQAVEMLAQKLQDMKSLKSFSIDITSSNKKDHIIEDQSMLLLIAALNKVDNLQEVNLSSVHLSALVCENIARLFYKIGNLVISHVDITPEKADALFVNKENSAVKVNLSNCKIGAGVLEKLKNLNIIDLNLSYCDLCDNDIGTISSILASNKEIKQISLDGNKITANGFKIIAKILKDHPGLEGISLNNNSQISNGVVDYSGVSEIFDALVGHKNIKKLQLSKVGFENILPLAAKVIRNNKSLVSVDLSHNIREVNSTNPNLADFLNALTNNTTLLELDLSGSGIDTAGLIQFAAILPQTKLRKLNLQCNNLDSIKFQNDPGLLAFTIGLSQNASLEELDITNMNISQSCIEDMFFPESFVDCGNFSNNLSKKIINNYLWSGYDETEQRFRLSLSAVAGEELTLQNCILNHRTLKHLKLSSTVSGRVVARMLLDPSCKLESLTYDVRDGEDKNLLQEIDRLTQNKDKSLLKLPNLYIGIASRSQETKDLASKLLFSFDELYERNKNERNIAITSFYALMNIKKKHVRIEKDKKTGSTVNAQGIEMPASIAKEHIFPYLYNSNLKPKFTIS